MGAPELLVLIVLTMLALGAAGLIVYLIFRSHASAREAALRRRATYDRQKGLHALRPKVRLRSRHPAPWRHEIPSPGQPPSPFRLVVLLGVVFVGLVLFFLAAIGAWNEREKINKGLEEVDRQYRKTLQRIEDERNGGR